MNTAEDQTVYQKILGSTLEKTELIFSEEIHGQLLEIRQFEHYRWMNIGGNSLQTLMDVDNPRRILLPYLHAMLAALLYCQEPASVLNLGMGGGTFERSLLGNFSTLRMTTVEVSERVISAAKRYFIIPEQVSITNSSAEDYLSTKRISHDIIFCDIFSKESHPACLFDSGFYATVFRALTSTGVLAVNLSPPSEAELMEILLAIRVHFSWVSLLSVSGCTNIILFVTRNKPPKNSELQRRADQLKNNSSIDLTRFADQIHLLPPKVQN